MKRDEADRLLDILIKKVQAIEAEIRLPCTKGGYIHLCMQRDNIRNTLIAALTGSDGSEVDLSERILDIPVTVPDDLPCTDSAKCFVIGFRTAQLAAAARTTGTWRKVKP